MTETTPSGAPLFTVAVCTWNRAARLRRALESHAAQRVPDGLAWEMIVVDNCSTDETPQVIEEFAGRLPLRRVAEPHLGLSHARNAAAREARGAYVVWTDDDVFVGPDWLAAYARAVRDHPDAAVFGGPIHPHFEPDPPEWLVRALPDVGGALALLDLGRAPLAFDHEQVPFGANYVVRTAEQRRHPYSPALGRVGAGMGGGEEVTVVRAILAAGAAGWWVPDAEVRHLIGADRQTLDYLGRFCVGAAESAARTFTSHDVQLLGRPRWVWREAFEQEARYRLSRAVGAPPERWARHFLRANVAWGLLRVRSTVPESTVRGRGAPLPE